MRTSGVDLALPYSAFPHYIPPPGVLHEYKFHSFTRPHEVSLAVRRDFFNAGDDTGRHRHEDFYSLYVVLAGHGVAQINDRPYGIAPGDVYFMPPGAVHSYRNYQRISVNAFYFQMELFTRSELASLRRFKNFWKLLRPDRSQGKSRWIDRRMHLSPERNIEIQTAMATIQTDICEPAPLGALLAHHQFFCLLVKLARWHESWSQEVPGTVFRSAAESPGDERSAELGDTVRYCEENSHLPLTVPQLAARLHLSPSQFSRLFTASMRVPPATFLRRLRLERAQMLLRTTTLSVAEVATSVGMRDPDSFSHAFRAAFGVTPLGYRKSTRT